MVPVLVENGWWGKQIYELMKGSYYNFGANCIGWFTSNKATIYWCPSKLADQVGKREIGIE